MAAANDRAVERMASLTFALLGANQNGGDPFRTADWIQANVPGYPQNNEGKDGAGAFRKMLRRDAQMLHEAGVPIIFRSGHGTEPTRVCIDEDSYRLPEVNFTHEEAIVLGLAGGLGQKGGLSMYSKTGWTKIAAAGTTGSGQPQFSAAGDIARIPAADFRELIGAIDRRQRITFSYKPSPTEPAQTRTMDPWGLIPREGRVYVVGWDIDRSAPRSFRFTRIDDIRRVKGAVDFQGPTKELPEVVAELIEPRDLIDATVKIPTGTAHEIADLGRRTADNLVKLEGVSLDWLARTAIGYAPDVEVLEPESVRHRIRELLGVDHGQ